MPRKTETLTRINNDGKLRKKYDNSKSNAIKDGIVFLLTFDQYVDLIKQAGLTSSRLSRTNEKHYALSRISNQDSFTLDNCRFIACLKPLMSSDERFNRIKEGVRYQAIARTLMAAVKRDSELSKMDQRYVGVKNGQFGSFWITDGTVNKKWRLDKGVIPTEFHRGRV